MIRVPSLTIVRPWPGVFGRRRSGRPDRPSDKADKELARRQMAASIEIERAAAFSAQFSGRKLF
jgi:hypothetical protein